MPNSIDLHDAIATMISDEVRAALAPYQNLLARMADIFGEAPTRREPGRPHKAVAALAARVQPVRRWRGSVAKSAQEVAGTFAEGQRVTYNQGRGTFEAEVVRVEAGSGTLLLARLKDGKEIRRPAAKVTAG